MRHLTDEQIALHFYGEGAAESAEVSQHLHECDSCRANLEQLEAVLGSVEMPVPERPEHYEATVWHNLRGHLPERESKKKWWWVGVPQRWTTLGAVVAVVIAAFFLGRLTQVQQPAPPKLVQNAQAPQIMKTPEAQRRQKLLANGLEGKRRLLQKETEDRTASCWSRWAITWSARRWCWWS